MKRPLLLLALLCACAASLLAETRTLTDQFGRSITAELIELNGNTIKIRREDGVVFNLPLENLSVEDQRAIRAWAASQAKQAEAEFEPDPKLLPCSLSRVKLKTTTLSQYGAEYKYVSELWGYSIQLTNKHLVPVDNLRVEYNLTGTNAYYVSSTDKINGTLKFDALRPNETSSLKTKGIEIRKEKSTYWGNNGGDVNGIWIRVYYKDKLIHDIASPESLKTTESWRRVDKD